MKKINIVVLLLLFAVALQAQQAYKKTVKPTKNLILMIPDGTSIGVVSAARWYQMYNKLGGENLAIDPYLSGTVKTYNSNAPIGDSAPTTSCYMTGYLSQASNVAIYPLQDTIHDIYPVDPSRSYQPLTTILEAAKYDQQKATGLVVTVEFAHATPADCSAHHYNRGDYKSIASQMAYNNLDVVFGGGTSILTDDIKNRLEKTNTKLLTNDVESFRKFDGEEKIWALFAPTHFPFDMDRDNSVTPSLEEMTQKAIERLSKNQQGFFLMVEGSQVDHAAHANDPVACMTEYLAFDRAVRAAMEFAEKDGETTVLVMSDHGNSGFTIGERNFKNYTRRGLDDVFGIVSGYKASSRKLESILVNEKPENFKGIIKDYLNIDVTEDELELLYSSKNYKEGDYMNKSNSVNLGASIVKIMNARTHFGFSTGGHTGEEVLLACYHPYGNEAKGMNTNQEINQYMRDVLGLDRSLDAITDEIFAKHTDVFKGMDYKIEQREGWTYLTVKKGKKVLTIPAHKAVVYLNDKEQELRSVVVYIDKNNTFYLPKSLAKLL